MTKSETWTVRCQDTADGSGDFIVDLPPELLAEMGWGLGDILTVEVIDGALVLKPITYTPHLPEPPSFAMASRLTSAIRFLKTKKKGNC